MNSKLEKEVRFLLQTFSGFEFNWRSSMRRTGQLHKGFSLPPILAVLLFCSYVAIAQSDERKFEAGGQFSFFGSPTRTVTVTTNGLSIAADRELAVGFGGRLGYNLSRYLAFEAEVNFFPRDRDLEGGRKIQSVFGLRAGKRFEKFGIFAKARPGFVHSSKGNYELIPGALCGAISPPSITCFSAVSRTNFAFDLGGVFELYPSKRTIIRFDTGDTLIRHGSRSVVAVQPAPPGTLVPARLVVIPVASDTSHNFQMAVGFGFRF